MEISANWQKNESTSTQQKVQKRVSEETHNNNDLIPMAQPKETVPSLFNTKIPEFKFKTIEVSQSFKVPELPVDSVEAVSKQTGFSPEYVNNVIKMEGFETKAYKDAKGIKTIGVGHNIEADKNYHLGDNISKEEAYSLLKNDLIFAKDSLSKIVNVEKLSQGQKEALTDMVFNVGKDKLKNSNLIKYINDGNYNMAVKEFNYICVGKNVNTHLCKRRILNLKSFSDGMDKNVTKEAMNILQNRGINDLNQKIKSARSNIMKKHIKDLKDKFVQETSEIINKLIDICK